MGGGANRPGFEETGDMAAMAAAKLQLMQPQTFHISTIMENNFSRSAGPSGFTRSGGFGMTGGFGSKAAFGNNLGMRTTGSLGSLRAPQQRINSTNAIAIEEVQALAGDAPLKGGDVEVPKSAHEALLMRLKSRVVRQEAENSRGLLANMSPGDGSEARLASLIKSTAKKVEELTRTSEELQLEAQEAERRLERANGQTVGRATEAELQAMNAFERSQRRIQEDKKEEEVQRQREEVQAHYAKIHRRLQSELIELRDYKVLLREFRRLRLERLGVTLGLVTDGRRLRSVLREMIRHGAQRLLQRLEAANLPLEQWMREVLVNCCHLEIRIEDAEASILVMRKQALKPVMGEVQAMLAQTKQERFEQLCTRTWSMRLQQRQQNHPQQLGQSAESFDGFGYEAHAQGEGIEVTGRAGPGGQGHTSDDLSHSASIDGFMGTSDGPDAPAVAYLGRRIVVPEHKAQEMRAAEAELAAMKRLLADMRHNAAAVICNQIRQAEKGGGREASREAMAWGRQVLMLMVHEDFAKATMKELNKSAPTAKLTD